METDDVEEQSPEDEDAVDEVAAAPPPAAIRKPYFVYRMAATDATPVIPRTKAKVGKTTESDARKISKIVTHIGKSRAPVFKVLRHNEGRVKTPNAPTKRLAPKWRLEEWIGPFATRRAAREIQQLWFKNSRSVRWTQASATIVDAGPKLAEENRVLCYTPRANICNKA